MGRHAIVLLCLATTVGAQPIREFTLDPQRAVDLPVSREITTLMFPGAITAVAGADMLIEGGKGQSKWRKGRDCVSMSRMRQVRTSFSYEASNRDAAARLTVIFDSAPYVVQLRSVAFDSVASAIFTRPTVPVAVKVDTPPEPVKFTPRIGLSLLDRARAYPVLAKALPKAVEGVTLRAQNRKVELPNVAITVDEVYRFAKEDAVVFLLTLKNTTDSAVDLAPSTFAARVANERFEQSIANGPRTLRPGESAEAEFAIVGLPDGSRNDLSADNAFTILVNSSRREPTIAANRETLSTENSQP